MPEAERNALLLAALRRLVRGLSTLFWGVPLALVVCVQTALGKGDWLRPLGFLPVLVVMGMLLYGLSLFGRFQPQERIWMLALERGRYLALANFGLAPFLFFWSKIPGNEFFLFSVLIFVMTLLGFLFQLNTVLARLAAMLPDETLRGETNVFTRLNQSILVLVIPALPLYFLLRGAAKLPRVIVNLMLLVERSGGILEMMVLLFCILLPVAMTMAMLWKTKEVILSGVFARPEVTGSLP